MKITRPTKNDFEQLIRLADCGSLLITTTNFVANRIHPVSARRLMDLGFATYGPGGRGNSSFIVPTEYGVSEANLAIVRNEANSA